MKRFFYIGVLLALAACSQTAPKDSGCPPITIPRETTRLYQNNGKVDEFQVNLVGFESSCYTDPANNRRYADIAPVFKIRRLEASSTTSLDVDFFVRSSINSEDYLGIRSYNQVLRIPEGVKEHIVTGRTTKNRIALPPYKGFSLELGIKLSGAGLAKSKGMYDIDYRYFSSEDIASQNEKPIEKTYLEIGEDEEVIYSEIDGGPIVVKKKRRPDQSCCQN